METAGQLAQNSATMEPGSSTRILTLLTLMAAPTARSETDGLAGTHLPTLLLIARKFVVMALISLTTAVTMAI